MDWFRDQMKKGMNARTYALVGFLVLVLLWVQSIDSKRRDLRARMPSTTLAPAPAVALPVKLAEHGDARASATPAGWGRDPFERRVFDGKESAGAARPVARSTAAPATGLYLQGIMDGPLGRTALINGEIYREGQRIGTREVIQIGQKAVMILDKGNVTTLTLKGDGG
ncbi:MAG TPA: hypothetical protein VFD83_03590 [Candidatus Polarisedimenticolia bacterium]|nr:hypothetical protein [Candidatus Polarisedimenticolia bacterium]